MKHISEKGNYYVRITLVWKQKRNIKSCIWSVAPYGSETWTLGKNEERVLNAFETWCWRGMLKINWTDRITNDECSLYSSGNFPGV